jgi:uncharacterized membrane protein
MNKWFIWALLSALFAALTAIRTTVILVITWALAFATSGKAD